MVTKDDVLEFHELLVTGENQMASLKKQAAAILETVGTMESVLANMRQQYEVLKRKCDEKS